MTTLRVVIENVTYMLLFAASFWFTSDIIGSFNSAQSSFTETQVGITLEDLPALTFCFVTSSDENVNFSLDVTRYDDQAIATNAGFIFACF